MKRIGLISDTHGYLGADVCSYLTDVDEIWHAGDLGDLSVCDQLRALKPTRIVYGNIDGGSIRRDGEAEEAQDGEEATHAKNDGSGMALRRKIFAINYCSRRASFCVCHPQRPKTHFPSPCPKYVLFLPA